MQIETLNELQSRVAVLKDLTARLKLAHEDDDEDEYDEISGALDSAIGDFETFVAGLAQAQPIGRHPDAPDDPPPGSD